MPSLIEYNQQPPYLRPYNLLILLALLLKAAIEIAGVSSIYKGSSDIFFDVSINLSNCSSEIFPLLISLDLILDCSANYSC